MRKCKICGAEFQEKNAQQKYCSDRCRVEVHRRRVAAYNQAHRRMKPEVFTITCQVCGKIFTGTSKRLCYCSPACRIEASKNRSKAYWEKRKEAMMREQTCAMCGKTFMTTAAIRARFCPDCRPDRRAKEKALAAAPPKRGEDRLNAKIREAMEKHISYGQLQVIAAQEAARAAWKKEKT